MAIKKLKLKPKLNQTQKIQNKQSKKAFLLFNFSFPIWLQPKNLITGFALIASLTAYSKLQAQTYICIGEDQVPEYTQKKTSGNCKAVKLPGISYGSGASNSNYVYAPKYSAPKPKKEPVFNAGPILPKPNFNGPSAGLPPLPSPANSNPPTNNGYAPPSSLPKNLNSGRQGILQQELTEKQSKLSNLQKEYKQGVPDRTEKNYQMYLDRSKKLGDEINRTQGDIDALLREMKM